MPSGRRPEIRAGGTEPTSGPAWRGEARPWRRAPWVIMAVALLGSGTAHPEDRVLVQGLADVEAWQTDARAGLFSLHDGRAASLSRVKLWAAGQLGGQMQGFALGEGEGGSASEEAERAVKLEQAFLRYTAAAPLHLVVQAGKLTLPFGNFSRRYFSSVNPLIGAPLNYEVTYPIGVQVNGAVSRIDYMVAAVDGPLTRLDDLPEPTSSLRPAVALGLTPIVGLRLGAYATRGSYLGRDATPLLPPGTTWSDFHEEVLGFDLQFSRGHFELNGEHTWTRLEVPGGARDAGWVGYLEPRYAWSPRWFTALRLERGRPLALEPIALAAWSAERLEISDLEAGVGFRAGPRLIVKATYRTDLTANDPATPGFAGHAMAMQISYNFDVTSWLHPGR